MKVKVERCTSYFRLSWRTKTGQYRPIVIHYRNPDDTWWDRNYSKAALDLLESCYGLSRANVRFMTDSAGKKSRSNTVGHAVVKGLNGLLSTLKEEEREQKAECEVKFLSHNERLSGMAGDVFNNRFPKKE